MRLVDKRKAIELRRQGFTYNEILRVIPKLSKSTLSGWLKNIELTKDQQQRIINKINEAASRGRIKGAWTNKKKWKRRIKAISEEAKKEFPFLIKKSLFLVGLSLYWAEGTQKYRRFQFINSNPQIIETIMRWLREVFEITNDQITLRMYIHNVYRNEKCVDFWSKIAKIPTNKFLKTVYKPTPHTLKKNPEYKGCLRIEVRGNELFWKIQTWQDMLRSII